MGLSKTLSCLSGVVHSDDLISDEFAEGIFSRDPLESFSSDGRQLVAGDSFEVSSCFMDTSCVSEYTLSKDF